MISLSLFNKPTINNEYFILINDALPNNMYEKLDSQFISLKDILIKQNKRVLLSNWNYKISSNDLLSTQDWNDFIKNIECNNIFFNYKTQNFSFLGSISNQNDIKEDDNIGCLFFKNKNDIKSIGGNLELYLDDKRLISIPYQKNTFVMLKSKKIKYKFTNRSFGLYSMYYLTM